MLFPCMHLLGSRTCSTLRGGAEARGKWNGGRTTHHFTPFALSTTGKAVCGQLFVSGDSARL
jgi:hypothetical protein